LRCSSDHSTTLLSHALILKTNFAKELLRHNLCAILPASPLATVTTTWTRNPGRRQLRRRRRRRRLRPLTPTTSTTASPTATSETSTSYPPQGWTFRPTRRVRRWSWRVNSTGRAAQDPQRQSTVFHPQTNCQATSRAVVATVTRSGCV